MYCESWCNMKLIKPVVIRCSTCGEVIEVDMDMECVGQYERGMGAEFEHEGIVDDICPNCGNHLSIRLSVWEYPVGVVNHLENEISGGDILQEPHYSPYD